VASQLGNGKNMPQNELIKIGMLRKDKSFLTGTGNRYDEILFYIAANFGVQLILFDDNDVDFAEKTISGTTLANGRLEEYIGPIPKIIDNKLVGFSDIFFAELDRHAYRLRYRIFTGKQKSYELLKSDGRFAEYLIPSIPVNSIDDIIDAVTSAPLKRIIVKHVNIDRGEGVFGISRIQKGYRVTKGSVKLDLTLAQFRRYYDEHIKKYKTIWQPFVTSVTKHGAPFDIRISCRRGADGRFDFKHYVRVGNPNGVISNWSAGGYTMGIDGFIQSNYPEEAQESLRKQLDSLGAEFPEYYTEFFDADIFDVGLDVGIEIINGKYKLWFFEINTDLGGGSIYGIEEQIIHCRYFRYLAEKFGLLNTEEKEIDFSRLKQRKEIKPIWPIKVIYKSTVHDRYYCNTGVYEHGLTHNNGERRKKKTSTLESAGHNGFDIIAKPGTKVTAVDSGEVITAYNDYTEGKLRIDSGGNYIVIKHDGAFRGADVYTSYYHLQHCGVKKGDRVRRGKIIGLSGNTGDSLIPHLHIKVCIGQNIDGNTIDPLEFLPELNFDKLRLRNNLSVMDGFPISSVELYKDMLENHWDFTVKVKAKNNLLIPSEKITIPAGTILELIKRTNEKCTVMYNDLRIVVPSAGLLFVW